MMKSFYKNPFVECTARDMSYDEVINYWCSPFGCFNVDEDLLFNSRTPIIIQGARGSGKTMILKYLSYFCQEKIARETNQGDIFKTLCDKGGIGFYFRYKVEFEKIIQGLRCSEPNKIRLFSYYFELYIIQEILLVLENIEKNQYIKEEDLSTLRDEISKLLHVDNQQNFSCFLEIIDEWIWEIDDWISVQKYCNNAEDRLDAIVHEYNLLRRLCRLMSNISNDFAKVKLMVIIDEYENVGDFQRVLNTYLKQVDSTSNLTFRVGMRPSAMKTYKTHVADESLQIDRDYMQFILANQDVRKYKKFIKEVATCRLKSVEFFEENNVTDIEKILGSKENFDEEAKSIVDNKSTMFKKLNVPEEYWGLLSSDISPIMQLMNIVWFKRGKEASWINAAMNAFLNKQYDRNSEDLLFKEAYKYKLDYSDKYRLQLLCVLCGLYSVNKEYYSFNTFAYLSAGAVNDFISLCRNTFYQIDEEDLALLAKGGSISNKKQTRGAQETANEQLDKIQLYEEYGSEMYNFAMNMGEIFKNMHKDIQAKYPETTQFAFNNEREIEENRQTKEIKDALLKWGVIIRRKNKQNISIGKQRGTIYSLNRIYAPVFNISYRIRGGYNYVLSKELFKYLITNSVSPEQVEKYRKGLQNPKRSSLDNDTIQMSIFGEDFIDE